MTNTITIGIEATTAQATAQVDALKGKLEEVGPTATKQGALMGLAAGGAVIAFNMAQQAIGQVTGALEGAVQAAIADEQSQALLGQALEANIPMWSGNVKAIEDVIKSRENLGFTDEEQRASLALLVAKTGDATQALDIQRVAMDLARLKGIDLSTATKAVTMGMEGQGRGLIELGIKVKDFTNKQEVMTAVEAKAAGQAETFAGTTAGAMAAMNVQIDDATKSIGQKLMPVVRDMAVFMSQTAVPAVETFGNAVGVLQAIMNPYVAIQDRQKKAAYDAAIAQRDEAAAARELATALESQRLAASGGAEATAELAAQAKDNAEAFQSAFEAHMQAGQTKIADAVKQHVSDVISAELNAGAKQANGIAATWSEGLASQLGLGEPAWMAAIKGYGTDMVTGMTANAQLGYIMGVLNSKTIAQGLASGKPGVATETTALVNTLLATLDELYGPAYLASYNFGSGIVDAAAKAIAAAQIAHFGQAGGAMSAGLTVKAAAKVTVPDVTKDPAFTSLMNSLKGVSGAVSGGGGGSISQAAKDATAKLKDLATAAKDNLGNAFDRVKANAHSFFDALHSSNLKAIDDTRNLANAQLDSQIGAINSEVQAARDALKATQDARRLAQLQAAVGMATTPEEQQAAQQDLSDFMAEQNITRLENDAQTKITALEAQKQANDDLAKEQTTAEDLRYNAQVSAYDKEMKALQEYLDKQPTAWKATSDKVLKLMLDQGVSYAAVGAYLGSSFANGLAGDEKALASSAQAYSKTSVASGGIGSVVINVNGSGDPQKVADAILQALKRETQRQGVSLA